MTKTSAARDERLIRRPNAAHALRAHLAEVLRDRPVAEDRTNTLKVHVTNMKGPGTSTVPSVAARRIAEGVRNRSPGYAHLFDPASEPSRTGHVADDQDELRPVSAVSDLGILVRKARETLGLSQGVFAARAGVGRRFLSELEAGKPSLEIDKVLAVCRTAGVAVVAGQSLGG